MLSLDPTTTALVVIDLQRGILSLPATPHAADDVVARSAALGRALAGAGGMVAVVNVAYGEGYADRPTGPVDARLRLPAAGLPEDWAELAPDIAALPARVRITKRQHSAFFGTELDLQLRRRGIRTVVLCGLATNFGVEGTARDAYAFDYAVVVAADACSSTGPGLHDFAVREVLPRVARISDTAEVLAAIEAAASSAAARA